MKANDERVQQVLSYMKRQEIYSFSRFAAEHNLLEGSQKRGPNLVIACPFHVDESPSCSLNDNLHAYHCFSCGRHGNYVSFISEYRNCVQGIRTNFMQVLNEFVREDQIMQATLGFASIFDEKTDTELKTILRNKIEYTAHTAPETYLELITKISKHSLSEQEKLSIILMIQRGMSIEAIWEDWVNTHNFIQNKPSKNDSFSLQELLQT